jgi:hypothetical protein
MAAYEESLRSISLLSDSSIAVYTGPPGAPGSLNPNGGYQYRFLKVTGKDIVGLATDKSVDIVVGVLQNKPQVTGAAATVAIRGVTLVTSGAGTDSATIAAGSPVSTDTTGRAILADDADKIYGVALQGSTTDGELISVLLKG